MNLSLLLPAQSCWLTNISLSHHVVLGFQKEIYWPLGLVKTIKASQRKKNTQKRISECICVGIVVFIGCNFSSGLSWLERRGNIWNFTRWTLVLIPHYHDIDSRGRLGWFPMSFSLIANPGLCCSCHWPSSMTITVLGYNLSLLPLIDFLITCSLGFWKRKPFFLPKTTHNEST